MRLLRLMGSGAIVALMAAVLAVGNAGAQQEPGATFCVADASGQGVNAQSGAVQVDPKTGQPIQGGAVTLEPCAAVNTLEPAGAVECGIVSGQADAIPANGAFPANAATDAKPGEPGAVVTQVDPKTGQVTVTVEGEASAQGGAGYAEKGEYPDGAFVEAGEAVDCVSAFDDGFSDAFGASGCTVSLDDTGVAGEASGAVQSAATGSEAGATAAQGSTAGGEQGTAAQGTTGTGQLETVEDGSASVTVINNGGDVVVVNGDATVTGDGACVVVIDDGSETGSYGDPSGQPASGTDPAAGGQQGGSTGGEQGASSGGANAEPGQGGEQGGSTGGAGQPATGTPPPSN